MKLFNLVSNIKIEEMEEINNKTLFDYFLIYNYTININDYDQ